MRGGVEQIWARARTPRGSVGQGGPKSGEVARDEDCHHNLCGGPMADLAGPGPTGSGPQLRALWADGTDTGLNPTSAWPILVLLGRPTLRTSDPFCRPSGRHSTELPQRRRRSERTKFKAALATGQTFRICSSFARKPLSGQSTHADIQRGWSMRRSANFDELCPSSATIWADDGQGVGICREAARAMFERCASVSSGPAPCPRASCERVR